MVEQMSKQDLALFKKVVSKQLGSDIFNYKSEVERISTGSLKLDDFIGSIVSGTLIEIYGSESCGKSTLASIISATAQKNSDKAVGILDVEHVWNHEYAKKYGLNYSDDKLIFVQPNSGEDALALAEKMLESGLFKIVILDSVAAMLTKKQLSGDIGDATIGELARLMSVSLPKINRAASSTGSIMIFINQTRSAIGTYSPTGNATSTPGGKALKFFCSLRLELKKRDFIVSGVETIGQEVRVNVKKNKFGRNNGYVDVNLYYNHGFKLEDEIVDLCKNKGIIEARGAWIFYKDLKWNGSKALIESVKNDKTLFLMLFKAYEELAEKERSNVSIEVLTSAEDNDDIEADEEDIGGLDE